MGPPREVPPGLSRSDTNIKLQNLSSPNALNIPFVPPIQRRHSVPVKPVKSNSSNSNQKSSKNSNKNNNSKRKKNKSNSKNNNNNLSIYDKKGAGDNKKHNIYQPPKK